MLFPSTSKSLGKPHVRILGVQPEFYRKGVGGVLNRLAKWVVAVL